MKDKNSKQWGYKGRTEQENKVIAKGKRGKVIGLCNKISTEKLQNTIPRQQNDPDIKYARIHLPEKEYNRRMKRYELRAKLKLSLFNHSLKKFVENLYHTRCAACGVKAPKQNHLGMIGWVKESITLWSVNRVTVIWCPACYKEEQNARAKARDEVYQ